MFDTTWQTTFAPVSYTHLDVYKRQILMDGKPTYLSGDELMSLLKSTPATNADKIDLITQPSARQDVYKRQR